MPTIRGAATAMVIAAGGLAACGGLPEGQDPMAKACQFKACVCGNAARTFWWTDTQPVIWSGNGVPSCPPGFALREGRERR